MVKKPEQNPPMDAGRPATNKTRNAAADAGKTSPGKRKPERILFAASEVYPYIKTGGLADVAGYLPVALREQGFDIRIVLPAYEAVTQQLGKIKTYPWCLDPDINVEFRLLQTTLPGSNVPVYLVDVPGLFDRDGGPYQDTSGKNWPDNAERFALFCRVLRLIAWQGAGIEWQPDLLHCNDWHTGLAPALLAMDRIHVPTVFTIHNLAYQGDFSRVVFESLKLSEAYWSPESLEFYNNLSFIKGGLVYADKLTTVSPQYAKEITTAEYGNGMDGLLRYRANELCGILNGVDYGTWNPEHDPLIDCNYNFENLAGKKTNKRILQNSLDLDTNDNAIVLAHISRLTHQKGTDLILQGLSYLLQNNNVQLVVLGTGDAVYENKLLAAARNYTGRIAVILEYNETLAHSIQAAADIMLMPSRFEPCGLTQLYSLRYGTIPVVCATGGLVDTVVDTDAESLANQKATGFRYITANMREFIRATSRAINMYGSEQTNWQQLVRTAMRMDFSWTNSARQYGDIYTSLISKQGQRA